MIKKKAAIIFGLAVLVLLVLFGAATFTWKNNEVTQQSTTENTWVAAETPTESQKQTNQVPVKVDIASPASPKKDDKRVTVPLKDVMIFRVKIPDNTPKEDTISISLYGGRMVQMKKVGDYLYEAEISSDQIAFVANDLSDKNIWYAYTRNQFQDTGASYNSEFIPGTPNTNDYFGTRRGRSALFKIGTIQKDEITRWKWFFEKGWPSENISDLGPDREFGKRIQNERFRSGQGLMDEYRPWMDHLFVSTAKHMRENDYEWIVFFPAWNWESSNPPKVRYLKTDRQTGEIIGFPDEKMHKQIRDFKKEGLKIILAPQICCTNIEREGRSREWWKQYWEEIKRVYVHYAKMAHDEGVEALVADFAPIGNTESMGEEISQIEQKAWADIWSSVSTIYSGERGQMIWQFESNMGGLSPEPNFITWADKLDFFYVQNVTGISDNSNPTTKELYQGAKEKFLDMKRLYDMHNKPILVQSQFSSVPKAWKGEFSEDKPAPDICDDDSSDEGCDIFFSGRDQAIAVNAFWQVIAENPWVIGYTNFGYRPEEIPLKPEWSVRGKATEQIWQKWNYFIM